MMLPPHEVWQLPTRRLGRRVLHFERLDSTNRLAADLANDPDNDGLVLLAREQTAGRGQHGRTWTAPPGSSVLLSLILFPPPALRRAPLLTAWVAVSVCELVHQLADVQAKIKWPNDVLIRDKKVCGILIEQRAVASGQWSVTSDLASSGLSSANCPLPTVCGIGLNVSQPAGAFAQAGLADATSLTASAGIAADYQDVARRLICRLDEDYDRLLQGDLGTLEACWKCHLGLLGKPVIAEAIRETVHGRLMDLTFDAVQIETATGQIMRLAPEAVRQLTGLASVEA
jgi:BirA family biotin operon repressor/biotin-[acetyl-CoA-carboxylase] ligase